MNFLRKRFIKIAALSAFGVATVGGITAGVAVASLSSQSDYDFIVSANAPANTLNYLVDDNSAGSWTLTNSVEGIFSQTLSPLNTPVHQILGISPLRWTYYRTASSTLLSDKSVAPLSGIVSSNLAPGMATSVTASSNSINSLVINLDIRTDSYWSNGDQVSADDFIDSIKYVLLSNNISRSRAQLPFLQRYKEFAALIKDNNSLTLNDFDNNPKYNWFFSAPKDNQGSESVGGVYSIVNRDKETGRITSQSLNYNISLGGAPTTSSLSTFGQLVTTYGLFFPSNRKFIESIGGFSAFGKDEKSFVSNGPFYIKSSSLDFQTLYKPNPGYWDSKRVLNKGYLKRVISNTATTQSLFKTGKISNTIVSPDQYRIYAADPELKRYLKKGVSASQFNAFIYNLDSGPNRIYLRNVHFRRAIKYAIDRKSILAALGYDESIPMDLVSADLRSVTDENGVFFRDFFIDPTAKDITKALTMNTNGFIEKMVYYNYETINNIAREEAIAKGYSNDDPQYNPELALKEFELFEQEMKLSNNQQNIYDLKVILSSTFHEQSQVLMDQFLNKLFNGRIRMSGFFVASSVYAQYQNSRDPTYDVIFQGWSPDTQDPFTYLRLWALTSDPNDTGSKYNVAFDSYLVYTSPNGFKNPDQFPMMDDMERIMGFPNDPTSFKQAMFANYGIDWITWEDWSATKKRLLGWQSTHVKARIEARDELVRQGKISEASAYDVSGVVNTNDQVVNNHDLQFWFRDSFVSSDGTVFPAVALSTSYRYEAIMEVVLKSYAVALTLFQSAISVFASTLIGAVSTSPYFVFSGLSFKVSYPCSRPPSVQWSLPGCEAITDTTLPIGG